MFDLTRSFRFDSAHRLPHVPPGHRCARMHGHSYRCDVVVRGDVDPQLGWVVDFGDIKAAVQPVVDLLDHQVLNDIEGLDNPTAELIARWIWDRVAPALPGLHAITLQETANASCTYRGGRP